MKCSNCGANLPDGTVFCEFCGRSLIAEQNQEQPKKRKNVEVALGAKQLLLIMVGVALLVMFLGHVVLMNTSIENVRPISMLLEMSGEKDAVDDLKDEVDELTDELEDEFDRYEDELEDELGSKGVKLVDNVIDAIDKCSEKLSINNFKKMVNSYGKLNDAAADLFDDLEDEAEELAEIQKMLSVLSTGLLIASLLSLLFTVIGGLVRKNGLIIAGMVFSTFFCLMLYSWVFIILNIGVHVVMIKLVKDAQ